MNTYQWKCLACQVPNVVVHDDSKEGEVTLKCGACGEPGTFEPEKMRVMQSPGFPQAYTPAYPYKGEISTASEYIPVRYDPRSLHGY